MQVMGILNLTEDSFSDGGRHPTSDAAIAAARQMLAEGADLLDIGAESTRPGATPVPPDAEQTRLLPVVRALAGQGAILSIDTRNAATMAACLNAGATLINDVSALTWDKAAAPLIAARGCRVILMHTRGTPQTMSALATYTNVVAEVAAELAARRAHAEAAGIAPANILLDPGLGFAKTAQHSLTLLANLSALGTPLVVGASRKRFIGAGPQDRLGGSIAAAILAAQSGVAMVRVHDVAETVQALRVVESVRRAGQARPGALPLDPAGEFVPRPPL